MTNPTSNFGWQMPTSTDLVTDLPADFEVFGQAVDTSLADLKGGTSGQVLSKNSNTDMDFVWVTSDDANAIQNAIVDAKGDLITATAADTPARLGVGTNGQILTADSTTATGLKWAAASGGSFTTAVQNIASQQATTSTAYTDLSTVGPQVTITTGTKALVSIVSQIAKTGSATPNAVVSFAISGATTLAAANNPYAIQFAMSDAVGGEFQAGGTWVVTGLTAGSNTFTMKYRDQSGGTSYFANRTLSVIDLGS